MPQLGYASVSRTSYIFTQRLLLLDKRNISCRIFSQLGMLTRSDPPVSLRASLQAFCVGSSSLASVEPSFIRLAANAYSAYALYCSAGEIQPLPMRRPESFQDLFFVGDALWSSMA